MDSTRRSTKRSSVEGQLGLDAIFQSMGRYEVVLLVCAVMLLLVLIYTIQSILSPFTVLGAIIFLLFPLRRNVLARTLMWLSFTLFILWFLNSISGVLAPFILSLILAYVLNPVVTRMAEWKFPRWLSALILIVVVVGLIILILFFVLPIAIAQFEAILEAASNVFKELDAWLWTSDLRALLERYGVSVDEIRTALSKELAPRFEDILKDILQGLFTIMSSLSKFATQVFYIVMIPFLTFYLLTDLPIVYNRIVLLVPRKGRDRFSRYLDKADEIIGRYLRGALIVALFQGIAVSVLFAIFGIKYALLLGILAAILDLVPYFGLIVTMLFGVLVAAFSDPPTTPKIISALIAIGVLHLVEVTLLSPKIVGDKIGLHPLLIILSLLVFAYFLGFLGLLIAIPATALIILAVQEWEADHKGTSLIEHQSHV